MVILLSLCALIVDSITFNIITYDIINTVKLFMSSNQFSCSNDILSVSLFQYNQQFISLLLKPVCNYRTQVFSVHGSLVLVQSQSSRRQSNCLLWILLQKKDFLTQSVISLIFLGTHLCFTQHQKDKCEVFIPPATHRAASQGGRETSSNIIDSRAESAVTVFLITLRPLCPVTVLYSDDLHQCGVQSTLQDSGHHQHQ